MKACQQCGGEMEWANPARDRYYCAACPFTCEGMYISSLDDWPPPPPARSALGRALDEEMRNLEAEGGGILHIPVQRAHMDLHRTFARAMNEHYVVPLREHLGE